MISSTPLDCILRRLSISSIYANPPSLEGSLPDTPVSQPNIPLQKTNKLRKHLITRELHTCQNKCIHNPPSKEEKKTPQNHVQTPKNKRIIKRTFQKFPRCQPGVEVPTCRSVTCLSRENKKPFLFSNCEKDFFFLFFDTRDSAFRTSFVLFHLRVVVAFYILSILFTYLFLYCSVMR